MEHKHVFYFSNGFRLDKSVLLFVPFFPFVFLCIFALEIRQFLPTNCIFFARSEIFPKDVKFFCIPLQQKSVHVGELLEEFENLLFCVFFHDAFF